jgi:hypothetical protein
MSQLKPNKATICLPVSALTADDCQLPISRTKCPRKSTEKAQRFPSVVVWPGHLGLWWGRNSGWGAQTRAKLLSSWWVGSREGEEREREKKERDRDWDRERERGRG